MSSERKKLRVLQLAPYPPPEGGVSRNALAIRDELLKNGDQCSIIALTKSDAVTDEPDVYHPRKPLELLKLLAKLEYDALHVHIGGGVPTRVLLMLAACAFFGRGASVLTFHSGGYAAANVERARKTSFAGFVFRRFKKIIAVNPLMIRMFENFGVKKENLSLIAPFVHQRPDESIELPAALKEFAERHQPFLLSASLLEDAYDLFMQIDAMAEILKRLPKAGLMIIGAGSLEADLKAWLAAKPYADKILLTGNVPHQMTLHLISRADILLRTTKFDGDAISVREALFLETPVIATDNKMRPEGVHLIPVSDANALINAIETLAKRERKPKTAKPDDRRNVAAVLRIYEELAGAKQKFAEN